MLVGPNIQNKEQVNDPAQKMVETWAKNYARDGLGTRIEALRLASDWVHQDGDVAKTVERAQAYLKFLEGGAG